MSRTSLLLVACVWIGLALSSCIKRKTSISSLKVAESSGSRLVINPKEVIVSSFRGVGVQWDPNDAAVRGYSPDEWVLLKKRLEVLRPPIIRVLLDGTFYVKNSEQDNKAIFYWDNEDSEGWNPTFNSGSMKKVYDILSYAQAKNIEVILGEWTPHPQSSGAGDPKWATWIADLLEHLIVKKGFTCIKYYNFINEPNGFWSLPPPERMDEGADGDRYGLWMTGLRNLNEALIKKSLRDRLLIIGPDTTDADWWVDKSIKDLGTIIDTYAIHKYASDNDLFSGKLEGIFEAKRELIDQKDPRGREKLFLTSEAALTTGVVRTRDKEEQTRVRSFEYGVLMSELIIQSMRGRQAGFIAWQLDDAAHIMNAYAADTPHKIWGFWNLLGSESEKKPRPWFYPMSLWSRLFPRDAQIVRAQVEGNPRLRATAALISKDGKAKFSVALVNSSQSAIEVNVSWPEAFRSDPVTEYRYFSKQTPGDSEGMPLGVNRIEAVKLGENLSLRVEGPGVVFLSSVEEGMPTELAPKTQPSEFRADCKDKGYSRDGILCTAYALKAGEQKCVASDQWLCLEDGCAKWMQQCESGKTDQPADKDSDKAAYCRSKGYSADGSSCAKVGMSYEGQYVCQNFNKWQCVEGCAKWIEYCLF